MCEESRGRIGRPPKTRESSTDGRPEHRAAYQPAVQVICGEVLVPEATKPQAFTVCPAAMSAFQPTSPAVTDEPLEATCAFQELLID